MKNNLHIVQIIPTLNFGGAERFVVDLINNCDSAFQFSLITFFADHPLAKEINRQIAIKIVTKRGQISWPLFSDLEAELKKLQPDVVHTHLFGADLWGRVAAKRLGLPVVTTEHNLNHDEGILKHVIKRYLRGYSDVYTAPSKAVAEYMRQAYRIKNNIEVIQHGVELDKFLGLPDLKISSPVKFFILARLSKQKGHRLALQALDKLKNYEWQLEIIGEGEEKNFLLHLTKKFSLENRVKFLPFTHEVVEAIGRNQVFIFPSLWEGLGIVLMEVMAGGRAVVASRTGGIPEIINHGQTGWLVPPGDSEALAKVLENILQNPDQAEKIAQQGRSFAQDNFALAKTVKKYEKIYQSLV